MNIWKKIIGMTVGAVVFSAAIALFIDNLSLAPGGVGGISILLNRLFPFLDTGAWILLLNIPLLVVGLIVFGKRFLISTVYTTVLSSVLVDIIGKYAKPYLPLTDNVMLGSMAGGALLAVGIGVVFRSGGTTGGMDIVVKLLRRRFRHMKTATLYMFTDIAVVLLAIPVMRNIESAMYSAVSLIITNIVLDKVLYGGDGGTLFYIVTETPDAIAKRILDEVELGVTYLNGEGAYTGEPKRVILCVARKQLAPKIRDVVKTDDPGAFSIVTPASEVLGEGFNAQESEEL